MTMTTRVPSRPSKRPSVRRIRTTGAFGDKGKNLSCWSALRMAIRTIGAFGDKVKNLGCWSALLMAIRTIGAFGDKGKNLGCWSAFPYGG